MSDGAAIIHIDGASRGNPGDAAYAIVIEAPGRAAVEEAGVLGKQTNNVAEYTSLLKALAVPRTPRPSGLVAEKSPPKVIPVPRADPKTPVPPFVKHSNNPPWVVP